MATTSGMYSGLLQTSSELARAEEAFAGAASKGLEEGVKPLQSYLMGVAAKEQQRLDQLKADQGLAIEYMNTMADTSGLLGEFEGPMTQFAIETKNKLNEIATNESLGQYEKAAAYKEAVDAFNKKAMMFSNDQEIMAKLTGMFAKGELSGAVNMQDEKYKTAKAFALGNFKIKNGKYIIDGVGEVDSNYLKNLYLPPKTIDANKTSAAIAALGSATTNRADLDRDLREFARNVGTVETAQQLLVDGLNELYTNVQGKSLEELQAMIVRKANDIATPAFLEAKPAAIKLSDGQIMGRDSYTLLENSIANSDFSNFIGGEINPGESISGFRVAGNKVQFEVLKRGEQDPVLGATFDLNNVYQRVALGKILIDHTKATAGESLKALNTLRDLYFLPTDSSKPKEDPKPPSTTTVTLPEYFNTFSTDIPNQLKDEDGKVIKSKNKEDNYVRSILNVTGSKSMGPAGFEVAEMVRSDYNGVFSEANIRKAAYELNYDGVDSKGRPFGKSAIEAADLAGQTSEANQKAALLAIDSASEESIDLDTRDKLRNENLLSDIQTALNTNKSLSELTNKDIAIYNYIKAGGQLNNYETALADLKKEKDDNLNSLEI